MKKLLFLLIVGFQGAVLQGSIIVPPTDATGEMRGEALFECQVSTGSNENFQWKFSNYTIYSYVLGKESYPVGINKYSVSKVEENFALVVKHLSYGDGGIYSCHAVSSGVMESAVLIVLDIPYVSIHPPNATDRTSASYICTAKFGGPRRDKIAHEHYPRLSMLLENDVLQVATQKSDPNGPLIYHRLKQVYNVTHTSKLQGKQLKCMIKTVHPMMQLSTYYMLNISRSALGQSIIVPPVDATGYIGREARFECEVKFERMKTVHWKFNEYIVYAYLDETEDYPAGTDKYFVSKVGLRFTLVVKDLSYNDGGIYSCAVVEQKESAQLIVLDMPEITVDYPDTTGGLGTAICTCDGKFGGAQSEENSHRHYPFVSMYLNDTVLNGILVEKEPHGPLKYHQIMQIANLSLTPQLLGQLLTCQIETVQPQMHLTVGHILNFNYPVRDVSYTPMYNKFEIGDVITCTAHGSPNPAFEWEDMNNKGCSTANKFLNISSEMLGENFWKCTASNVINGQEQHMNVTIQFEAVSDEDPGGWKVAVGFSVTLLAGVVTAFVVVAVIIIHKARSSRSAKKQDGAECNETLLQSHNARQQHGITQSCCYPLDDSNNFLRVVLKSSGEKQEVYSTHENNTKEQQRETVPYMTYEMFQDENFDKVRQLMEDFTLKDSIYEDVRNKLLNEIENKRSKEISNHAERHSGLEEQSGEQNGTQRADKNEPGLKMLPVTVPPLDQCELGQFIGLDFDGYVVGLSLVNLSGSKFNCVIKESYGMSLELKNAKKKKVPTATLR